VFTKTAYSVIIHGQFTSYISGLQIVRSD